MSRIVAVALKWADLRPEIDPLSGDVRTDPRTSGASDADRAALEWALRLAAGWGWEVLAVTAGPEPAEAVLHEALAVGATRAVRVEIDPTLPSAVVASALAHAVAGAELVLCGDLSPDRGSGAMPAFLAAELDVAQALGVVVLRPGDPGVLEAERRLDGGRRERLRVRCPAVVSVEGATARLRRAPLHAVLAARRAAVTTVRPAGPSPEHAPGPAARRSPLRPRPRVLPPPDPGLSARERILALTGALVERTPPQQLSLDPPAAAEHILQQLTEWGRERP